MQRTNLLILIAMISTLLTQSVHAGGIAPGATRVIYPEGDNQTSLSVTNSDSHERYLIQSWVSDSKGQRVREFIVTPPLFAASPKSENTLRIVYVGKPLPTDREVVYWMNIKAIPAVDKSSVHKANTLQLAVLSRMKLFMRPSGLQMSEPESADHLQFQQSAEGVTIKNPTPYYQSIVNITAGTKKLKNIMIDPFGQVNISLPKDGAASLHYQTINDYGAVTEQRTIKF